MSSSADDFRRAWRRRGLAAGPALLDEWSGKAKLEPPSIRLLLLEVFAAVGEPRSDVGVGPWRTRFVEASYPRPPIGAAQPGDPPRDLGSVALYRAENGRARMVWMTDPTVPRYVAQLRGGPLLTVVAPPGAILALAADIDVVDPRVIVDPDLLPQAGREWFPPTEVGPAEPEGLAAARSIRIRARLTALGLGTNGSVVELHDRWLAAEAALRADDEGTVGRLRARHGVPTNPGRAVTPKEFWDAQGYNRLAPWQCRVPKGPCGDPPHTGACNEQHTRHPERPDLRRLGRVRKRPPK